MLTISHLTHKLRLSASVQWSCCRLPPGAARTAPTPCTTHSMSIRFESESKANERRRMQEMPHYTSTWIGYHVRPNKQRNWSGDQLLTQSKGGRLTKKSGHLPLNLLRAHNVTALILSYKRSHSDRHRRLVIMKTGGARTIEATSMVKIQSSKIC